MNLHLVYSPKVTDRMLEYIKSYIEMLQQSEEKLWVHFTNRNDRVLELVRSIPGVICAPIEIQEGDDISNLMALFQYEYWSIVCLADSVLIVKDSPKESLVNFYAMLDRLPANRYIRLVDFQAGEQLEKYGKDSYNE